MELINLEANKIEEGKYKIKIDIQPLADKLGISKEKLAELMAESFMKLLGIT